MASLLYDHVILAAAYFWQSSTMYSLLPYIENLVSTGDILPSIRTPYITRDVIDYFEKRVAETAEIAHSSIYQMPALASEIARPNQKSVALELDRTGTIVYTDVGSVEDNFRCLWLADTLDQKNPFSIYNIVLAGSSTSDHSKVLELLRHISTQSYFSRSLIAQEIDGIIVPRIIKSTLINRASNLYLLANAQACNSDLLSTSRSLLNHRKNSNSHLLGPLVTSNIDLFTQILELCGIPSHILTNLTNEEILLIKYSEEFYRFRETYFELIKVALKEQDDFVNNVWLKFSKMWAEEHLKKKLLFFLRYAENVSSWFFAAALGAVIQQNSPFTQTVLMASGMSAGVSYILRRLESLNRTPLVDFAELVIHNEYRNRLHLSRRLIR